MFFKMNRKNAERTFEKLKDFHRGTIAPLLNSNNLVVGNIYPCDINVPGIDRAEFEVRPFGTATNVSAIRPQAPNSRWALRIFPASGGIPFRIEDDNRRPFAHVNTADPTHKHVRLKIPQDKIVTYGAIGSTVAGYYEPESDKDLPSLLQNHINFLAVGTE